MSCPNGHDTTSTDYCDVCGVAIPTASTAAAPADPSAASPAAADPAAAAPTDPAGAACPSCSAPNLPDALFCEACGYDFTTGTMPRPLDPPDGITAPTPAPDDDVVPPDATSTAPPLDGWVAEVWIDPDWYAHEGSTDPLPSPGMPRIVTLANTSVLIGRASRSRGITPDIDLSSDNGISRRHAQLTTDGTRWFVEDLGSSNGTYVGGAMGQLPDDPVPPSQKQELGPDDRIYVGAWTRVVVRRAAPGEI